jgi:hypothetical protein
MMEALQRGRYTLQAPLVGSKADSLMIFATANRKRITFKSMALILERSHPCGIKLKKAIASPRKGSLANRHSFYPFYYLLGRHRTPPLFGECKKYEIENKKKQAGIQLSRRRRPAALSAETRNYRWK